MLGLQFLGPAKVGALSGGSGTASRKQKRAVHGPSRVGLGAWPPPLQAKEVSTAEWPDGWAHRRTPYELKTHSRCQRHPSSTGLDGAPACGALAVSAAELLASGRRSRQRLSTRQPRGQAPLHSIGQ